MRSVGLGSHGSEVEAHSGPDVESSSLERGPFPLS